MEKVLLERFIAKYNMDRSAEKVTLVAKDGKGITTKFITDDRNTLGVVNAKGIELEEGEYHIYDTGQLRALLGALENSVKVKVAKKDGKPTGITLSDAVAKVTFVLADQSSIPQVPELKTLPPFEVVIKLDQKLMQTFVKAKSALPDVETFTVISDGKKTELIIGYSELNTNRVALQVETTECSAIGPLAFNARYLSSIIQANKEMKSGFLMVSSKGLAQVTCEIDDFEVIYWLLKKDRQD